MLKSKETHPHHYSPKGEYYPARHHDMYAIAAAVGGTVKSEGGRERVSIPFESDLFEDSRAYEISIFSNCYSPFKEEWNTYSVIFMTERSSMMDIALKADEYSTCDFSFIARIFQCGHPKRDIEEIARKLHKRMERLKETKDLKKRIREGFVGCCDDAAQPVSFKKQKTEQETPASPPTTIDIPSPPYHVSPGGSPLAK